MNKNGQIIHRSGFFNPLKVDHTQKVKWFTEWTAEVSLRT